jgi:hypothetical protein
MAKGEISDHAMDVDVDRVAGVIYLPTQGCIVFHIICEDVIYCWATATGAGSDLSLRPSGMISPPSWVMHNSAQICTTPA